MRVPGMNAIFSARMATVGPSGAAQPAGASAQGGSASGPSGGIQKAHGQSSPTGGIALAFIIGGMIIYGVWMYLVGERQPKDAVKKLIPNLQVIVVTTASAVLGILLLKLGLLGMKGDLDKTNSSFAGWLNQWIVTPLATVFSFV